MAPKVVVWVGTIATRREMLSEGKRHDQLRLKRAKIVLNTAPLSPVAQYTCESAGKSESSGQSINSIMRRRQDC